MRLPCWAMTPAWLTGSFLPDRSGVSLRHIMRRSGAGFSSTVRPGMMRACRQQLLTCLYVQSPSAAARPTSPALDAAIMVLKARLVRCRTPQLEGAAYARQCAVTELTSPATGAPEQGTRPSSAERTQRRTWSAGGDAARQAPATPARATSPGGPILRRPASASAAAPVPRPRLVSPSPPAVMRAYASRGSPELHGTGTTVQPRSGGPVTRTVCVFP